MGKAIILSHIGSGQYNIRLLYDNVRAQARITVINNNLVSIDSEIPTVESELLASYNAMFAKQEEINAYIALHRNDEDFDYKHVQNLNSEFFKLRIDYEKKFREHKILLLRKSNLEKELLTLQTKAKDYDDATAWCADITEDLSGYVGTIESCYERNGKDILILPGHINAGIYQAIYSETRDGRLTTYWNQLPAQLYTNRAYLPAVAKWKPRYRTGTITAKPSQDTCNISLDPFLSSQQSLDTNQTTVLNGVPIVYMTCNGKVFEVGDSVVVAFDDQDWEKPKVIGFTSNPRECIYTPIITWPDFIRLAIVKTKIFYSTLYLTRDAPTPYRPPDVYVESSSVHNYWWTQRLQQYVILLKEDPPYSGNWEDLYNETDIFSYLVSDASGDFTADVPVICDAGTPTPEITTIYTCDGVNVYWSTGQSWPVTTITYLDSLPLDIGHRSFTMNHSSGESNIYTHDHTDESTTPAKSYYTHN